MKKILLLLILLIGLVFTNTLSYAAPYSIETDSLFEYYVTYDENDNRYALIDDYFGEDNPNIKSIIIPSTSPSGVPVTGIQMNGDYWGDYITHMTIPSSIKEVKGKFNTATALTEIVLQDGVGTIGQGAFYQCKNLKTLTIPSSISHIGTDAFDGCKDLESINVHVDNQNYTSIDGVLFNKLGTRLIRYPEGKRDTSYTIPKGTIEIEANGFENCDYLEKVTIGDFVTTIGNSTFRDCDALNNVFIPESVTNIGEYVFYSCDRLKKMTIPTKEDINMGSGLTAGCQSVVIYCYQNSYVKEYVMTDYYTNNSSAWHRLPEVVNEIEDQTIVINTDFEYKLPEDTFNLYTLYGGYTYTYEVVGLPNGIVFDSSSQVFSGSPTTVGISEVEVTLTESGHQVTDRFLITVTSSNEQATCINEIPDQVGKVGLPFSYKIPENTFANIDGYIYSADGMPSGIKFDAESKTFLGTPEVADLYPVRVTVSKGHKSISDTFNLSVSETFSNTPPVLNNKIPDMTATQGVSFTYRVPDNTFFDADGHKMTYTLSTTGPGTTVTTGSGTSFFVVFDSKTRTLSFTPEEAGIISVTIKATDEAGASVSDTFNINVMKVNVPDDSNGGNAGANSGTSSSSNSGSKNNWRQEKDEKTPVETFKKESRITLDTKKGRDVSFTIEEKNVKVAFNGQAFDNFKDKKVEAKIEKIDKRFVKIDPALKEKMGDLPMVEISIYVNDKKEHFESDQPIVVELAVDTDLDSHKVIPVYIDSDGNFEIVEGVLSDGIMKFFTYHLSDYALIYVDKIFEDVPNHWAKEAIEGLTARDILKGVSHNTFNPQGDISRAEFIAIMVRYFGFSSVDNIIDTGDDTNKWYTESLSIAETYDILPKIYASDMNPTKKITREEMMYILYKSLESAGKLDRYQSNGQRVSAFEDSDAVSDYALKGMEYLVSREIMNGYENKVMPNSYSTRGEVAQLLWNLLNK